MVQIRADFAECETWTAVEGRVTQRMQTNGRLRSFQNHAIQCDAWHLRLYDRRRKGVQTVDEMLLSSPDHRGATGPLLFRAGLCMDFVGEERLEVGRRDV